MLTVYSEQHKLRDAKTELYNGELVLPFEAPVRNDLSSLPLEKRPVNTVFQNYAHERVISVALRMKRRGITLANSPPINT